MFLVVNSIYFVALSYAHGVSEISQGGITRSQESHSPLGSEEPAVDTERVLEALLASCLGE